MRDRKFLVAFLTAATLLMITLVPTRQYQASAARGVRNEDLIMFYYSNVEAAYAALKADEIDVIGCGITRDLYEDAITDPNIVLSGVAETDFYELDLNNNYTIHTYPGVTNMFWYAPVRRAVAWCTDKDYIVDVICGGFAERIDAMIAAPAKAWANESYWYPNYPYEYDPAAASAHLDANGWVEGTTPNPHYDPGFPGSTQFLRVYPPEHSHAGNDVDIMQWYIRTDDLRRFEAGHMVADVVEKIGFTIERHEGDAPTLRPDVIIEKDYHVYTGGWGVGLLPLYLYTIYHAPYWCEGWPNYVTGHNASGWPNYPEYDRLSEDLFYAATLENAQHAAKLATAFWTEKCINVPLFSYLGYWANRAKLLALVNMEGKGFENEYCFMNAYKADGTAIRYGLAGAPNSMNPQFADFSYRNLDRCYSYAGVSAPPYDPATPQPGWLQDWEIGIWNDGGENKTMRTDWVRSDNYFAEPITGNQLSNVNASDYFFSVWYTYADPAAARYTDVKDVNHVEIHDDYSWTVYFDVARVSDCGFEVGSCFYYQWASPMLYPVDVWLRDPLALEGVENFTGFSGPGPVGLSGSPVWITEVTVDGALLAFGTDYNIIRGNLEILAAVSGDLSVDYWRYGDPSGFTPGNLSWEEILVGSGMYYLTSFTPGVGGGATYKRNPYYWMETPLLGEIDFIWKSESGPKPRTGYYKIDIYDVVLAASCFGIRATFAPPPFWPYISAADLAPVGGIINIYDIVTLTGQYGAEWGHTP